MSILDRIFTEAFVRSWKRFGTPNMVITSFVVLLREFQSPFISKEIGLVALVWLIVNALASPFAARISPFTTPALKDPHCNFCGSVMMATGLECPKCGSKVGPPKPQS